MMDLAALQAKAAAAAPMHGDSVPIIPDRTIYFDGDGLAYYCAGNDETTLAEARTRVYDKIGAMQRASGAGRAVILLTGSGGHKGHRYAIARGKPYQGQRANSRRPVNWAGLRKLLETGEFGEAIVDHDREADDRFGQVGNADPERTVIATQDKDMRFTPGYHMNWKDHRMVYLPPKAYDLRAWDLQFGEKWFWLQMLQGDTADNIPGLPRLMGKLCGEKTAEKYLAPATDTLTASYLVADAYRHHFGERWFVEMAEQAVLLWIRRHPKADWFEACAVGGPLGHFIHSHAKDHHVAWLELTQRVEQANAINSLAAVQAQGE